MSSLVYPAFADLEDPAEIELAQRIALQEHLNDAEKWVLFRLARWRYIVARPEQLMPMDAQYLFMVGGRGSGKTRAGAQTLFEWSWELPGTEWACIGPTRLAVRNLMFLGPSGLRNVIPEEALRTGDWDGSFNETRLELRLANGSVITGYSSERPGRIRGANLSGFWGDEPAEWKDSNQLPLEVNTTFSNLMLAVRAETEGGTRGIITGTPTPCPLMAGNETHGIPGLMTGMVEPPISIVRMSTRDNLPNLDAAFARLVMSLDGTRLGRQEIDAELLTDVEGAAWKAQWITVDNAGLTLHFDRLVIAVDPSGGDGTGEGDEVGIVICGVVDGNYWVLEDLSGNWGPGEWAELVWDAYKRWEPQCYRRPHLKVEGNYGKALAAQPLNVSQDRVPGIEVDIEAVKISKFKRAKASALLYEPTLQKAAGVRVRHAGRFAPLVNEMTTFLPESKWSPNRLDALTLGMNWLSQFDELPVTPGTNNTTVTSLLGKHSGNYR